MKGIFSFQNYLRRMILIFAIVLFGIQLPGNALAEKIDVRFLSAIVTGPAPFALELQAAKELQNYLKRIYGVTLKVESRDNTTGKISRDKLSEQSSHVILLGRNATLKAGILTEQELNAVKGDGYIIRIDSKTNRIGITGTRPRSTLFAVAGFLEYLGVKNYGAFEVIPTMKFKKYELKGNKELIPSITSYKIDDISIKKKPSYEFRRIAAPWQLKTSYDDIGDPRQAADPELFTKEKGSDLWIDHTAGYLVPKLLYYDDHPEYYAMRNDGRRIAKDKFSDHRTPLCLSNPDVTQISIERMIAWIKKQPEKKIFPITYGDTKFQCTCDNCRKLDVVKGRYADRILFWVNKVAKEVGKIYPDKIFVTLAYKNSRHAPLFQKPEKNVIVLYTPWWGLSTMCRRHPYYSCNRSLPAALEMEGWLKSAPDNLGVYDYSLGKWPVYRSYEKKLKFWAKRGYRGFWELGRPKQFIALKSYVMAKLAWDASLDPDGLISDFCIAYYGPAGEDIASFIKLYYRETGWGNGQHKNVRPQFFSSAVSFLEQAQKKVLGTIYEERFLKDQDLLPRLEKYKIKISSSSTDNKQLKTQNARIPDISKLWLSKSKINRKKFERDFQFTQIRAICTLGPSTQDLDAAMKLQKIIQDIYKIKLPVNPPGILINKNTKGIIAVGQKASLATGLISESDFDAARPSGAVVRGLDGRIALATSRKENALEALNAFLHILTQRHSEKMPGSDFPHIDLPLIREFTLIDWPPYGPVFL